MARPPPVLYPGQGVAAMASSPARRPPLLEDAAGDTMDPRRTAQSSSLVGPGSMATPRCVVPLLEDYFRRSVFCCVRSWTIIMLMHIGSENSKFIFF